MLLHFIWINKRQPFGEGEYTCLLSALKNTTYDVRLHTNLTLGESEWDPFPLQVRYPKFKIIQRLFEEEFEGVKPRIASVSDVYRIKILKEYGGAYSDMDILWLADLPAEFFTNKYVAFWENPSYKMIQNAFIYMEKGLAEADELLTEFQQIFKDLKARGITDLSESKKIKDHMLLYYATQAFSKRMCDPLPKSYLFKNGWRRIGRACRRQGLVTKDPEQDFGTTKDKIDVKDICGIHWGNSLFYWSSFKELEEIKCLLK
jgi:hypothetical protein